MTPWVALFLGTITAGTESVRVEAWVRPARIVAGQEVELVVKASIPQGFHVYGVHMPEMTGMPTSVDLEDTVSFSPRGPLREPTPERHYDEAFETEVPWHAGEPEFVLPLVASAALSPGTHTIRGTFSYQLCDERSCRIPAEVPFAAVVEVGRGHAAPPAIVPMVSLDVGPLGAAPGEPPGRRAPRVVATFVGYDPSGERFIAFLREGTRVAMETRRSLLPFLGAAVVAGLLSLLTPCVFPMIPVTVSFFSQMATGVRRDALSLAGTYCAGIVAAYTVVGLLASALLGASGVQQVAASVPANLVLFLVLVFFGLNLMGAFQFRISVSVGPARGTRGRYAAVLGMALAFTLASLTCTAGFVGALLVAASQGEVFWPLLGMLAYSVAFASPFFFLALFPGWLASLPQAGGWMNRIKVTLGFLLLMASCKFISNADAVAGWGVITRPLVLTVWAAGWVVLGLYLLGMFRLAHDDQAEGVGVLRVLTGVACFALALHVGLSLGGKPLAGLLEALAPQVEETAGEWGGDLDAALAQAAREGRRVLVDFSGHTCTNCKLMERKVFPMPEVKRELDRFVKVRLYTDAGPDKKRNQELARQWAGTLALPLYVVLEP